MTAHLRSVFGILGGGASGVIIALVIAHLCTPTTVGVCVAIAALCVIGIYACKAVEADRREWMRRGREEAWARREREEARRLRRIEDGTAWLADLKPWPLGDDEVRP